MREASAKMDEMRAVRALAVSVEGVLTDGTVAYGADGPVGATFHQRDRVALALARAAGWPVALLSSEANPALERWAADAGVTDVLPASDRLEQVRTFARQHGLELAQVAYLGEDLLDLPAQCAVGLSVAPRDAGLVVRKKVDVVLELPGGRGALRELVELLLDAQECTCDVLRTYFAEQGLSDEAATADDAAAGGKIGFRR